MDYFDAYSAVPQNSKNFVSRFFGARKYVTNEPDKRDLPAPSKPQSLCKSSKYPFKMQKCSE